MAQGNVVCAGKRQDRCLSVLAVKIRMWIWSTKKLKDTDPGQRIISKPVLRIRDVYPRSQFSIPDPGSKRYRLPNPDPQKRIKVFATQKTVRKLL
jgi:hypothetical protein